MLREQVPPERTQGVPYVISNFDDRDSRHFTFPTGLRVGTQQWIPGGRSAS